MMKKVMKKIIPNFLLAASLAMTTSHAYAGQTLRFAHFWPSTSAVHNEIFDTWAKSVEKASGGELKVNLYPSQTLLKAAQSYDGTVNGIADITATVQGYSAGRFPLSEITQLPGITESALQGACILQTLYDTGKIDQEYNDTHVLFMFTTGPAYLHTSKKEIKTPNDLIGLRMRRPNEVTGALLAQMGASPVGIPAPGIYEAMERGVVDGLSFPFEAMKVFRINDLSNYHLQIPYASGIFVATMNKRTYDRLTPEMKTVIDEHSGMEWAMKAAQVFNRLDQEGLQEAKAQGDTIHVVNDPLNNPDWGSPLKEGTERYLERIEKNGKTTAREVYQTAFGLREQCAS
ncbi:TRAP transporter substrate-binding protein [Photobacterium makurazakiensis]|uniref:TRAP transporter substrate-binding protein n=1 Tax=Photobacterium makurazakiensis TaxID=2910234 RepID=UPI003D12E976